MTRGFHTRVAPFPQHAECRVQSGQGTRAGLCKEGIASCSVVGNPVFSAGPTPRFPSLIRSNPVKAGVESCGVKPINAGMRSSSPSASRRATTRGPREFEVGSPRTERARRPGASSELPMSGRGGRRGTLAQATWPPHAPGPFRSRRATPVCRTPPSPRRIGKSGINGVRWELLIPVRVGRWDGAIALAAHEPGATALHSMVGSWGRWGRRRSAGIGMPAWLHAEALPPPRGPCHFTNRFRRATPLLHRASPRLRVDSTGNAKPRVFAREGVLTIRGRLARRKLQLGPCPGEGPGMWDSASVTAGDHTGMGLCWLQSDI